MTTSQNERERYWAAIHDAIETAALHMDLEDLPDDAPETDYERAYEERHHCGTCVVRSVMEVIWPSIDAYIDYLDRDPT